MNFTGFLITHIITHQLSKQYSVACCQRIMQFISQSCRFLLLLLFSLLKKNLSRLQIASQWKRVWIGKVDSKRRWRTIRKKESARASERVSEKEGKRLGGLRALCRARLFIYFCFWLANALHTLDSLSLSLFLSLPLSCRFFSFPCSSSSSSRQRRKRRTRS